MRRVAGGAAWPAVGKRAATQLCSPHTLAQHFSWAAQSWGGGEQLSRRPRSARLPCRGAELPPPLPCQPPTPWKARPAADASFLCFAPSDCLLCRVTEARRTLGSSPAGVGVMAPKETKALSVGGGLGHMDNVFKATAGAARGRCRADVHMGLPPFNLAGPENSRSQGGGRQVWGATHEGKD